MRRSRLRIVAGLALVGSVTAAALAVPPTLWKFKTWTAYGVGLDAQFGNPNVDGVAVVKVNSENITDLNIVVHNLQPNETYAVMFTRGGISVHNNAQAFTTNSKGKGMYQHSGDFGGDLGDPAIFIYKWNGVVDEFFAPDDVIQPEEERAVAIPE